MDLTFSESELAFRDELRAWFAANQPDDEPVGDEDAHYHWRRRLPARGWPTTAGPPCTGRFDTADGARP